MVGLVFNNNKQSLNIIQLLKLLLLLRIALIEILYGFIVSERQSSVSSKFECGISYV